MPLKGDAILATNNEYLLKQWVLSLNVLRDIEQQNSIKSKIKSRNRSKIVSRQSSELTGIQTARGSTSSFFCSPQINSWNLFSNNTRGSNFNIFQEVKVLINYTIKFHQHSFTHIASQESPQRKSSTRSSPKKQQRRSQSSNHSDKLKYSNNHLFSQTYSSLVKEQGNLSYDLGISDKLAPSTRINPFKPQNTQNISLFTHGNRDSSSNLTFAGLNKTAFDHDEDRQNLFGDNQRLKKAHILNRDQRLFVYQNPIKSGVQFWKRLTAYFYMKWYINTNSLKSHLLESFVESVSERENQQGYNRNLKQKKKASLGGSESYGDQNIKVDNQFTQVIQTLGDVNDPQQMCKIQIPELTKSANFMNGQVKNCQQFQQDYSTAFISNSHSGIKNEGAIRFTQNQAMDQFKSILPNTYQSNQRQFDQGSGVDLASRIQQAHSNIYATKVSQKAQQQQLSTEKIPISLPSIIDRSPDMMTVTSANTLSPLDLNERFNNAQGKNYTFTPSPNGNVQTVNPPLSDSKQYARPFHNLLNENQQSLSTGLKISEKSIFNEVIIKGVGEQININLAKQEDIAIRQKRQIHQIDGLNEQLIGKNDSNLQSGTQYMQQEEKLQGNQAKNDTPGFLNQKIKLETNHSFSVDEEESFDGNEINDYESDEANIQEESGIQGLINPPSHLNCQYR